MNRSQRRRHLAAWLVLTPALLALVAWAWSARPSVTTPVPATAGDAP